MNPQARLDKRTAHGWVIQLTAVPGGFVTMLAVHKDFGHFQTEPFEHISLGQAFDWLDEQTAERQKILDGIQVSVDRMNRSR